MYNPNGAEALNNDLCPNACEDKSAGRSANRLAFEAKQSAAAGWTEARIALLKKLWAEGKSGTDIATALAQQFPGFRKTRSAIIGKAHRLGLAERASPSRPARPAKRVARKHVGAGADKSQMKALIVAMKPRPEPLRESPVTPLPDADGARVTVTTARPGQCRYPYGDPKDADFCFCAHPTEEGATYCAAHRRLAYQPETPARRARGVRATLWAARS
jgi:GcrA cell cycle regulator